MSVVDKEEGERQDQGQLRCYDPVSMEEVVPDV